MAHHNEHAMIKSPRPQLKSWLPGLQEKLRMDSKRRFMLLLVFFNGLLIVILLLSVRNQEVRRRIRRVEQEITYRIAQLATIQANQVQIVRITATPAQTRVVIAAVTPTPVSTATALPRPTRTSIAPRPTATATALPTTTSTPTYTPTPTLTWTPTPTWTPTWTPSPTPTDTPTWTPSPVPMPVLSRIDLSASDRSIIADGKSTSHIRASVYDQFGAPFLDEVQITFSTSMGIFWGAPTVVVSSRRGSAEAILSSSTSTGVATVRAQVGSLADQIDVIFGPGPPHSLTLTASPARPTVQQATIIEATVRDEFGNRVADRTHVRFATTLGALEHQDAETQDGVARTTLSSNRPGQATVTATAGQATGTLLVEFVSLLSLAQVVPESGCNETPVSVTIVGSGFAPGVSAALGSWVLDVTWIDSSTLQAVIPQDIAAGTYDLVVSMPGGDRATLANAYTARDCGPLDTPLDRGYLGISGAEPGFAPGQGDDDQVQVMFLEVPEETSGPLYVRLFDPDCGGAHDVQNGKAWDTPFTFTVYGGPGAYTNPDARSVHPTNGVYSGNQLAFVRSTDVTTDGQWYSLGPLTVADGESVNGKRLFKLSVVGGPEPPFPAGVHFADLNTYSAVLSTSDTRNVPPEGSRLLAFSWTFLIPRDAYDAPPRLYPYVSPGTQMLIQHNWDYDRSTENAGMSMITPQRTIQVAYDSISGDNEERSSAHDVRDAERNTTWAIRCWAETIQDMGDNLVTFWASDQDGGALPIFARSTTGSPP